MAKRFLLIDDDPEDSEIFSEALGEIDPNIVCNVEASGVQALARIDDKEFQPPDIIFLDVNMPVMSGWDVLIKLKAHRLCKNIPVVMYSTSSRERDIDRALRCGAILFFMKPFDYMKLKKSLEVILRHMNNQTLSEIGPLFSSYESA